MIVVIGNKILRPMAHLAKQPKKVKTKKSGKIIWIISRQKPKQKLLGARNSGVEILAWGMVKPKLRIPKTENCFGSSIQSIKSPYVDYWTILLFLFFC